MMLTCSTCVFLIVYRSIKDNIWDVISCIVLLLIHSIVVPSYVAQPIKSYRCYNCQKMGFYGAIIVCLSDYMLIIDVGYKINEGKQGRDGIISAFPLRDYVVMLTYYAG